MAFWAAVAPREAGVFHEIQLAVISPFTRALQTALRVIPQDVRRGFNGLYFLVNIAKKYGNTP